MNCVLIKCHIRKRTVVLCHSWVLKMLEAVGRAVMWGGPGLQGQAGLSNSQIKQLWVKRSLGTHLAKTDPVVTLTSSQIYLNSHNLSLFSIWKQNINTVSKKSLWTMSAFPGRNNGPRRLSPAFLLHTLTQLSSLHSLSATLDGPGHLRLREGKRKFIFGSRGVLSPVGMEGNIVWPS